MSEPFLGEIRMFAGGYAPRGWAACNGQIMAIAQNQALFAILGTTYGGNGVNTFALPDLRGRLPMNWGQGPALSNRTLGQTIGAETVTVGVSDLPPHIHVLQPPCNNTAANTDSQSPVGAFPATQDGNAGGFAMYASATDGSNMAIYQTGSAGGSQPHSNLQPSLAVTFMIAITGIFPTRN